MKNVYYQIQITKLNKLFKDLALVELLASKVTFPGEVFLNELLGLRVLGVQLLPGVGLVVDLPIGGELESKLGTTPEPDTGDGRGVVRAEQTNGTESVLAHLVKALEHAGDQVAAHEGEGQVFWVLVLSIPQRVVFWVEGFPEGWDRDSGVFVGVHALEVVNVERTKNNKIRIQNKEIR